MYIAGYCFNFSVRNQIVAKCPDCVNQWDLETNSIVRVLLVKNVLPEDILTKSFDVK